MWWTSKARIIAAGGAIAAVAVVLFVPGVLADGWNDKSKASATFSSVTGGMANTRHNLTMSYLNGAQSVMAPYRNDFAEICVYCHTPHGANKRVAAPLWNRTIMSRNYELYESPRGLGQPMSQPGPNSLTCLSCHDGMTGIDSIINMPTKKTGAYAGWSEAAESQLVGPKHLDYWSGGTVGGHSGLANKGMASDGTFVLECIGCHTAGGPPSAPLFKEFVIGGRFRDLAQNPDPNIDTFSLQSGGYLKDDHPIGVRYPAQSKLGGEFNEPRRDARIAYFDTNGNGHADPDEVRLYDSGDGYEVECASCHDPHGVRIKDRNELVPSFLRVGEISYLDGNRPVSNLGSKLCLTCHVK